MQLFILLIIGLIVMFIHKVEKLYNNVSWSFKGNTKISENIQKIRKRIHIGMNIRNLLLHAETFLTSLSLRKEEKNKKIYGRLK